MGDAGCGKKEYKRVRDKKAVQRDRKSRSLEKTKEGIRNVEKTDAKLSRGKRGGPYATWDERNVEFVEAARMARKQSNSQRLVSREGKWVDRKQKGGSGVVGIENQAVRGRTKTHREGETTIIKPAAKKNL